MAIASTLARFLADRGIRYDVLTHSPTESSAGSAAKSHVSGDSVAKAVVLKGGDDYLLAVLPATCRIELGELRHWLDRDVGLATEEEAGTLFADCELGAIPPAGGAYGLEVVLDESLTGRPDVYFEGGDHASLVHVTDEQFGRLMAKARRGRFSRRG